MCKFIKYEDIVDGATVSVYLNVRNISEVRHNAKDNSIEIVIGDPSGECETKSLNGNEAKQAFAIIAGFAKP